MTGTPDMCPVCEHDWCQCSQRHLERDRPSRHPTRDVDMSEVRRRMMDTVPPPKVGV